MSQFGNPARDWPNFSYESMLDVPPSVGLLGRMTAGYYSVPAETRALQEFAEFDTDLVQLAECTDPEKKVEIYGMIKGTVRALILGKCQLEDEVLQKSAIMARRDLILSDVNGKLFLLTSMENVRCYIAELESSIFPQWITMDTDLSRKQKWSIGLCLQLSSSLKILHNRLKDNKIAIDRLPVMIVELWGEMSETVHEPKLIKPMTTREWEILYYGLGVFDDEQKLCIRLLLSPLVLVEEPNPTPVEELGEKNIGPAQNYIFIITLKEKNAEKIKIPYIQQMFENLNVHAAQIKFGCKTKVYVLVQNLNNIIETKNRLYEDVAIHHVYYQQRKWV